jgi:MFS family permease
LHAAFSFGGLAGAGTGALAAGAGLDVRVHLSAVALVVAAIGLVWTRRLLPGSVDIRDGSTPAFVRPPRQLWALGALAFACLLLEGASADWSSIFMRDELGVGVGSAALGYTAFSLAMAIGRLAADRLTARLGAVRLVRRGGLLAVCGLLVVLLPAQAAAAVAGFACLGAGLAAVVPSVFRAASQASALPASVALAAVSSAGYLGFLVGPPLIGGLAQIVGLRTALFLLVALAVAATMLAPSVETSRSLGADPETRAVEPCPA